jgi:UDP:flavonoid glycosyltransferase YjiC (YdhE family)
MRVLFSSTRGTGHLHPLLPYAHALRTQGHEVLVAAPAEVGETLRAEGLSHAPFDHPGDDKLGPIWARLRGAPADEALAIAVREIFAGRNAEAALPKLTATIDAWKPDLIVRDSVEYGAAIAAARAGVPHARVAVHMVSFEDELWEVVSPPVDKLRVDAGLPADGGAFLRDEPVFSAFPASLDDPQSQRGQLPAPFRVRQVDASPRAASARWAPEPDPHPFVYITFGTIVGTSPTLRSVYRTALEAVASLPVRALLTTGRGMADGTLGTIPANVRVEEWVPQDEVLPHAAAIVCHGGSGTVRGGLAASLPMVVVPLGADQPHNGRRVARAGAGIDLPAPDAGSLGAAIQRLLAEADFRHAARRIAEEIAALPPVDAAVPALRAIASRG